MIMRKDKTDSPAIREYRMAFEEYVKNHQSETGDMTLRYHAQFSKTMFLEPQNATKRFDGFWAQQTLGVCVQ